MFDFCDLRVTESIGCQTGDFSPIVSFRKVYLFSLLLRFYCFLLLHFIHLVVDLCHLLVWRHVIFENLELIFPARKVLNTCAIP